MAITYEIKDTTALTDSEIAEMADICVDGPAGYDIGFLSKLREDWVLVNQARENDKLQGFTFFTLERIGGTPSLLWGLFSVKRTAKRDSVMKGMILEQYKKAVLAFPDEDVLVGTRLLSPVGYSSFEKLIDIVPRPDHKATGEERAWGRRLAKRFGMDGQINDRTFVLTGNGDTPPAMDIEPLKLPKSFDEGYKQFFADVDSNNGDSLVAFGWASAEYFAEISPGAKA